MTDIDRIYFQLSRPVNKYHERLGNVTRVGREEVAYFKDKDLDVIQKNIEWMSRDLLDAMLKKIKFGKDYIIQGNTTQEEDFPTNEIVIRQEMQIDELVKCKDCIHFAGGRTEGFCMLGLLGRDLISPSDYCSYGERREDEIN